MTSSAAINRLNAIAIAKVVHQANKAYCETLGDVSQVNWEEAPQWQRDSAINGVLFKLNNPASTPADSHANWLEEKRRTGWKYGEVKDVEKKEHPCFVPYSELPTSQQIKDYLFSNIVKAFMLNIVG